MKTMELRSRRENVPSFLKYCRPSFSKSLPASNIARQMATSLEPATAGISLGATERNKTSASVPLETLESSSLGGTDKISDQTESSTSAEQSKSPYEEPVVSLIDRYIDEPRPLSVAVIGGGLAGILAGILLPKKVPAIKLTIYEKNVDFVSASIRMQQ